MSLTDAQLAARKLGGSDAAIACGFQAFGKTQYALWEEITGRRERADISDRRHIRRGEYLEAFAAAEYEHETGRKLRRDNRTLTNPRYPWMTAHIDRRVVGERRIVECKAPGPWSRGYGEVGTDEVPDYVWCQAVHYMVVLDWHHCDVVVLRGDDLAIYPIERDSTADLLIEREREFWRHVERDEPPPLATLGDAMAAYPQHESTRCVASDDAVTTATELRRITNEIGDLEAIRDRLKLELQTEMRESEVLVNSAGDVLATWRTAKPSRRTNWRAVADQLATFGDGLDELAALGWLASTESTPSRRFLLK